MKPTIFAFLSAPILLLAAPLVASASSVATQAGVPAPSAPSAANSSSPLAAKWLVWALSQPAPANPFLDTTGSECANQQSGPTWLLEGFFGTSGSVARSGTVPARTELSFPLANYFDAELMSAHKTPADARRIVAQANVQSAATDLTVTFDGTSVGPALVQRAEVHRVITGGQSRSAPASCGSSG